MQLRTLGKSNLPVSTISFGASALGGVFGEIYENEGIKTVHAAIDAGINYIDVAPAYGGTVAETILGKALRNIDRDRYYISTKAGKYTDPNNYLNNKFDYSEAQIRSGITESLKRLGIEYLDIVHLHDFDYEKGKHADSAFDTGFNTLLKLKEEGVIGAIGAGIYDMSMWVRVINEAPVDVIMLHNHYCLNDTRALELLDSCKEKNIGIINASPFASSLLTPKPEADWHPANTGDRKILAEAASYCQSQGFSIAKIAFQFSSQQNYFPTTLFSSASCKFLEQNLTAYEEVINQQHLKQVLDILAPIHNKQWNYDAGISSKLNPHSLK